MIWYLATGKQRPAGLLKQELIAAFFVLFVVAPMAWWGTDRTPPQIRLRGALVYCPDVDLNNAGNFDTCYVPEWIEAGTRVRVKYWTTRRQREDCPGTVQQEFISSVNTVFSKLARPVGPAKWFENPYNSNEEIFIGQEVVVPEQIAPGPAIFRSVTFRYCNWTQRWMHWPIVQSGPDVYFQVRARGQTK